MKKRAVEFFGKIGIKNRAVEFFSGIACGVAVSVPGVSWGTVLVITGLYNTICEAISLKFKRIWENKVILLTFLVGLLLSVFGFSNLVEIMLEHIPLIFKLTLAALIACGTLPIVKKISSEKKPAMIHLIPALFGYALVTTLFALELADVINTSGTPGPVRLAVCSAIAGFASIIPGISGSFVLVILGTYETVITAVANFDFAVLAFAGLGMVTGFVGGSRIISWLLKKAHTGVYAAVSGMMVASVLMLIADAIIRYG